MNLSWLSLVVYLVCGLDLVWLHVCSRMILRVLYDWCVCVYFGLKLEFRLDLCLFELCYDFCVAALTDRLLAGAGCAYFVFLILIAYLV